MAQILYHKPDVISYIDDKMLQIISMKDHNIFSRVIEYWTDGRVQRMIESSNFQQKNT